MKRLKKSIAFLLAMAMICLPGVTVYAENPQKTEEQTDSGSVDAGNVSEDAEDIRISDEKELQEIREKFIDHISVTENFSGSYDSLLKGLLGQKKPKYRFYSIDYGNRQDEDDRTHLTYYLDLRKESSSALSIWTQELVDDDYHSISDLTTGDLLAGKITAASSNQSVVKDSDITLYKAWIREKYGDCIIEFHYTASAAGDTKITFSSTDEEFAGSVSADIHVINADIVLPKPGNLTATASADGTKLHVEWDVDQNFEDSTHIWIAYNSKTYNSSNRYGFGGLFEKGQITVNGSRAYVEYQKPLGVFGSEQNMTVKAVYANKELFSSNPSFDWEETVYTNSHTNQIDMVAGASQGNKSILFQSVPGAIAYRYSLFRREAGSEQEPKSWVTWNFFEAQKGNLQTIDISWYYIEGYEYKVEIRAVANQNEALNSEIFTSDWMSCSEQQEFTEESGIVKYYKNGEFQANTSGFVNFGGGSFFVANGILQQASGLLQDPAKPEDWYFCANGETQKQYTGLAQYDGAWFYVNSGKLNTTLGGFVDYNGGKFFLAAGEIKRNISGLCQDPQNPLVWYLLANGEVQNQYTGLCQYNGAWFYVIAGRFATEFTGKVEYNGSWFDVVNGEVK